MRCINLSLTSTLTYDCIRQESMKLMGMKGWLHWASWYFKFSVFMLLSVAIMTVFFHIKVGDDESGGVRAVITYSDPTVTFVFLLLYALSVVTCSFAISTFFSKGLMKSNGHCRYQVGVGHSLRKKIILWFELLIKMTNQGTSAPCR